MGRGLITVAAAILVLALAGAAVAASKYGKRIGVGKSSGDYAVVNVSGTAKKPKAIYVVVRSAPPQKIAGAWSVTCSKGTGAGSKSGSFNGNTPRAKKLRFPMGKPDVCYVGANAQLDEGGKIKVAIYNKHR